MPGPYTFGVTSKITPIEAIVNTDLCALFVPFVGGELPTAMNDANCLFFDNIGDITIGGDSVEQQALDLNTFVEYAINAKKTQGQISFSFPVDPHMGPPKLSEQTSVISSSPQGVLFIGKKKSETSTVRTFSKWAEFPVNFDHANDVSWPKNNAQTANAVFHQTGLGKRMGFERFESNENTITVTTTT